MKCPYCQSDTRVVETTYRVDGTTRRRRFCEKGHRFSTWQAPGEKEKLGEDYQPSRARGK